MKKKPWANTRQARIRAYQAAADILYEASIDPDTFSNDELDQVDLRAAMFYLGKLAEDMQKEAFRLEEL